MGNSFNGNGHGSGLQNLTHQLPKKVMRAQAVASSQDIKENKIAFTTADGLELNGVPVRITRNNAVFELYNPPVTPRFSEALNDFHIITQSRKIYAGRAIISNVLGTGLNAFCEVTLDENSWNDVDFSSHMFKKGSLRDDFSGFMQEWQRSYKILPEYKIIVADMQSFLTDLRLWLDQVDLGMRSSTASELPQLEDDIVSDLAKPILACLDEFFERFETTAKNLDEDLRPAHYNYMRRQLHPLVLNAPFAHRSFEKPLGYAGDYEMVNMIVRNAHQGGSLFAKIVNAWFLSQPPSQAHRNRIDHLKQLLINETVRIIPTGHSPQILDLACGPAHEVQRFMAEDPLSGKASITLLDFNEETLEFVKAKLNEIKLNYSRETKLTFVKKSVFQIIKESTQKAPAKTKYDVIFCAGLFDYLSDQVCHQLMDKMYQWLAPKGLLVVTNVEPSNPLRHGMGHLLDWHLNYRTSHQLHGLRPTQAHAEASVVRTDATGLNIFLEVRKLYEG